MLQPLRRRTWAPIGKTPLQNAWDRHERPSAVATLTVSPRRRRLGYYFSLWPHNITTEEVVWFLAQVHRYFRRKIILVLDRWQVHRSAAAYLDKHHPHWFQLEWLPAYAPELKRGGTFVGPHEVRRPGQLRSGRSAAARSFRRAVPLQQSG